MSFLSSLVAKLIEKLVTWVIGIIKKYIKEKKEIKSDESKAQDNAKKVDEAKTEDERKRAIEDLLNGN
jgi:hypothetical protein